jgi:hypothetical protein
VPPRPEGLGRWDKRMEMTRTRQRREEETHQVLPTI